MGRRATGRRGASWRPHHSRGVTDFPPPPDDRPVPPPPPADLAPPPGYAGYDAGMAAGATGLRSVSGPAMGSMIAVGATAVLGLLGAIVQYGSLDKAKDF